MFTIIYRVICLLQKQVEFKKNKKNSTMYKKKRIAKKTEQEESSSRYIRYTTNFFCRITYDTHIQLSYSLCYFFLFLCIVNFNETFFYCQYRNWYVHSNSSYNFFYKYKSFDTFNPGYFFWRCCC